MTKKIVFRTLPREVKKALYLLVKDQDVRRQALEGVGYHVPKLCPLGKGYGIEAVGNWSTISVLSDSLLLQDRETLIKYGWSAKTYRAFLDWYDVRGSYTERLLDLRRERENFLRRHLGSKE